MALLRDFLVAFLVCTWFWVGILGGVGLVFALFWCCFVFCYLKYSVFLRIFFLFRDYFSEMLGFGASWRVWDGLYWILMLGWLGGSLGRFFGFFFVRPGSYCVADGTCNAPCGAYFTRMGKT